MFASLGNQADLTETDVLLAATDDPETRVIAAYVEGVPDGERFLAALRVAAARKPVVLLKAGRSAEGARAVASHTGAIAGSDRAFEAAVRQAGAVRAQTVEELFDLARLFASQPLPRGRRVAIVTNGGGLGIVAADAARGAGLAVDPLDAGVAERLARVLPATATIHNPLDLVGDADAPRYGAALASLTPDAADALLVILTAQATTDAQAVARMISAHVRGWPIPVTTAFVGGPHVAAARTTLERAGLPCYPFPERAAQALARAAELGERREKRIAASRSAPPELPDSAYRHLEALRGRRPRALGMSDLGPLLEAAGLPVVPTRFAATAAEAATAAADVGTPVALKIVSRDVSHKSEVGGVRLGLTSPDAVRVAAEAMMAEVRGHCPRARLEGFVVQRMAEGGHELLLGMVRDAQFGPLVVVGFGGIYVEIVADTSARPAPISLADALEMLDELKMAPALRGARGRPPVDCDQLAKAIVAFGALAAEATELAELEINPLVAGPTSVVAVDARASWVVPSSP
jgi:acetate---CoA ligase (ADP-forming)